MEKINLITTADLEVIHHALASLEVKLDRLITEQTNDIPSKYIKASQVCKYFGFSRGTLEKLIAEGKIKAYLLEGRPNGDRFFKVQDLYNWEPEIMK